MLHNISVELLGEVNNVVHVVGLNFWALATLMTGGRVDCASWSFESTRRQGRNCRNIRDGRDGRGICHPAALFSRKIDWSLLSMRASEFYICVLIFYMRGPTFYMRAAKFNMCAQNFYMRA